MIFIYRILVGIAVLFVLGGIGAILVQYPLILFGGLGLVFAYLVGYTTIGLTKAYHYDRLKSQKFKSR